MSCPVAGDTSNGAAADSTVYYAKYLQLNSLLSSQKPLSGNAPGRTHPSHDEHLFVVVHQAFELWFKQILVELYSVRHMLLENVHLDGAMLTIATRLKRVSMIIQLFNQQFPILETMTPMDFLDFRDLLAPASGFQSLQFRLLENMFGVLDKNRVSFATSYQSMFTSDAEKLLAESCDGLSLFQAIEQWLERIPGLEEDGFNFPQRYAKAVDSMLEAEQKASMDESLNEAERKFNAESYKTNRDLFDLFLVPQLHGKAIERGERRLSRKATFGGLMIFMYRDDLHFNVAYSILQTLMDIDSGMLLWRHSHVTMVQRFLGNRMGTGGSSGYYYLRSTIADRYKVFCDLFNMAGFLLPREHVPVLTEELKTQLSRCASSPSPSILPKQPGYGEAEMGEHTRKFLSSEPVNLEQNPPPPPPADPAAE